MAMDATVKGLRATSKHIEKAEKILQGLNVVLESKYFAVNLKQLTKTQNALAELILIAPRIDSDERAIEFMSSVSDVEEMFSTTGGFEEEGLWGMLDSKPLKRAAAHLNDAAKALSEIDAEEEYIDENPDEEEDDE